jgi:hypothetical protein
MAAKSASKSTSHRPGGENPGRFLKIVGAATAVISLLLALNQVTGWMQDLRIHHKEFSEAMNSGQQELQRDDYAAAFRSFKHAADLDPIDRKAQAAETQAAMFWLENADTDAQDFVDMTGQTLQVLDNSLAKAKGQAAGDILAHIALADLIKYQQGVREGVNVDENLKAAFVVDPNNVYAHAIAGFWMLWRSSSNLGAAQAHFSAALTAGRVRPYVRGLQLSGLTNAGSPKCDAEELHIANEMRKSGEAMDNSFKQRIYWNNFSSPERLVLALTILPTDDIEATYDWLDYREPDHAKDWSREFMEANLSEVRGNPAQALAQYQSLAKQIHNQGYSIELLVNAAIQRLSHAH